MPANNSVSTVEIDPLPVHVPPTAPPQIRCEIITRFAELEQLAEQWDRLWSTDPEGEVFQAFAWNRAWWRANAANFEICTPVVWNGDRVIAILPLVKKSGVIQFMATPEADYADVICEERDSAQALALAIDTLFKVQGWSECVLDHLSCNSRMARHWNNLPARILGRAALAPSSPCPTVLLEKEPGLLKKLADKKHLRRHETKLQKTAPVEFRLLKTGEEIKAFLPDFIRQQILRRELLAESSSCLRPEFAALLQALAEDRDLLNRLRFFVLEWDGKPLAYHLGFEANNKFTMYQQTFNVDAWDYSAGEVLMRQLFLYASGRVTREFDFSVGEESYKNRFANHYKPTFTGYLENGAAGSLRVTRRKLQGKLVRPVSKLKQAVRERSKLYRAAKFSRIWMAESSAMMHRPAATDDKPHADAGSQQVIDAQLTDLAALHLECPGFRLATKLAVIKQRLRDGDKAYIVRLNDRPALLAWARKTGPASTAATQIYDCKFLQKGLGPAASVALNAYLK